MPETKSPSLNKLNMDSLVSEATSTVGADFTDKAFLEPLAVLVNALNTEANLNAIGVAMQRERILNSLLNRLRTEKWIALHPEILDENLNAPVFIVGLPRTGTTTLHRILASDSRFFAPLWYEVRNPAPYLDWQPDAPDQRVAEAREEVKEMLRMNPELASIHPMDPTGADEEIMLLEHSFYSYMPSAFCHVPSYTAWVSRADNTVAYQYLKQQLQFLQWQKKQRGESAERWLLKAPHHLHFMQILLNVFPDATIIQTHREPVITIPSITSFNYNLWLLGSDHPDKKAVASEWSTLFARGVQHTLETRQSYDASFIDVWFKETISNPLHAVERIYESLGMTLTDGSRAQIAQHLKENKREDRPSHHYTLEEYGYDEDSIRQQFAGYYARFIDA